LDAVSGRDFAHLLASGSSRKQAFGAKLLAKFHRSRSPGRWCLSTPSILPSASQHRLACRGAS